MESGAAFTPRYPPEFDKMTPMSGAALDRLADEGPPPPRPEPELDFTTSLVVSDPPKPKRGLWMPASAVGHVFILAAVILIPIFWPAALPEHPDYIRALIYNPPPPPPPPLPKGSALVEKMKPVKPLTPETQPEKPKLEAIIDVPKEEPLKPEAREKDTEQAGSPRGSDIGVPEGMDIGVEGGVVGGVPGGVLGGVVGGTGDGVVMDYDQPAKAIKLTRPSYPQEAFIKKIEGTVEVEILIDATGRVARARIVRSVPLLDAAALQTVREWVFQPALKHGRPVASLATAPVTFRIF
jgi:protein TonB